MRIERREFLKLLGGTAGALVLGGFGLDQEIEVPDHIVERVRRGPGLETWKPTVCGLCSGGCGLLTRLIDGIPVYQRGNPNYPVNFGGMCPLGHASLQTLFNPDRLLGPMQRLGPPGAGRFEPIDWSVAMARVTGRLDQLRSSGNAHQVAFLGWPSGKLTEDVARRFMQAYGSPNTFLAPDIEQAAVPYLLAEGTASLPAYDLLGAHTILSLGSEFLEDEVSPIHYTKLFANEPEGNVKTLIYAGPRLGLTGSKAHRWLPARPGSYGALALGIAHVLIREELYDVDFVRRHAFGFEDWTDASGTRQPGFRTIVLADYFPERVSELSGVPAEAIIETARELGIERPSVVLGGSGTSAEQFGTFAQIAVQGLNLLLGAFGVDGGVWRSSEPPLARFADVEVDETARIGLAQPSVGVIDGLPLSGFSIDAFARNLLAGNPYPIEVLFVLGGNPVFESIRHHDLVEALRSIPMIVSFDSFINETSEFADIVLPDHTFLEQWDLVSNVPGVGVSHVGVRQPVVEPMFDTRQAADVLADMARTLGGTVVSAVPFESLEEAIRSRVRGLYDSGTGAVATEGVQESWLEFLQQRGFHMGGYDSFTTFWSRLLEHGGWWNPTKHEEMQREFGTPSGRFEFQSQRLIAELAGGERPDAPAVRSRMEALGLGSGATSAFMPLSGEPTVDGDHDLHLVVFGTLASRGGVGANLPLMQELFGQAARRPWKTWVEIHPDTAAARGIRDEDWVRLESTIGSVRLQAKVTPTVRPDCVAVPFGQGHTSYGRYARYVGVNPHTIARAIYDPLSGQPGTLSTLVSLSSNA